MRLLDASPSPRTPPIRYADLIVEDPVIVLINFNVSHRKSNVHRIANKLEETGQEQ